uniref:Uncharacterized protein n=1 Tax=Tanacetum cinerariifolium TaxID=118510 RepID=A0A6L2NYR4_TANCI|nr:hypothetical protein [Tanacetum cinerariifolium]
MDLFTFIRHSELTKVLIGERDLTEREEHSIKRGDDVLEETITKDASEVVAEKTKKKQKRRLVGDASGSIHSSKKLRDDYQSLLPNTSGKSLVALRGSYSEATSFVRSLVADAPVVTVAVTTNVVADIVAFPGSKAMDASKDLKNIRDSALDTKTMHHIYVPKWKVMNDSIIEDPYAYRDLIDRLAPPALFTQLQAMDHDQLFSEFNVGAARHVCLGVEVKMQAKHTLERKGELKDKCAEQTMLVDPNRTNLA